MSGCPSCAPGCGCSDFGSKESRLPSLASIEVVSSLFFQAVRNTAQRAVAVAQGTMTPEALAEADSRLVNWMGATFSGENAHYSSAEDWNPQGLAVYIRDLLGEQLQQATGTVPDDDEEVIYAAAGIFLADLYRILNAQAQRGADLQGVEHAPACARLVDFWSRLMTGAPAEMLLQ